MVETNPTGEDGTKTFRPSTLRRGAILLFQVLVSGFVVYYLWSHREELAQVWTLSLGDASLLVFLVAVGVAIRGWEFQYLLACLGAKVNFTESLALIQGATLLNYAPFSAGSLLRANALKRQRSLSYTNYAAMMSAQLLVLALASGLLGLVALVGADIDQGSILFGLICGGAILGALIAFRIPPDVFSGDGWFRGRLRALLVGWQRIGRDPKQLAILVCAALAKLIVLSLRFYIAFGVLGMPVNLLGAVVFASVSSLVIIVSITPGSLGIRELLIASLATMTGLGFAETMAAASLDRIASVIAAVGMGVPSLVYLRRRSLL